MAHESKEEKKSSEIQWGLPFYIILMTIALYIGSIYFKEILINISDGTNYGFKGLLLLLLLFFGYSLINLGKKPKQKEEKEKQQDH
jgi:hypothetical protein